ncbi:hypothetical protein VTN77DRAFT_1020 [Rasamsonia byssochlamydoides]|uniref:uncharacterized protein n=1 Tax=Rasamsonia byssochlamydoides TaxID=89139 RepID=UPI0037447E9C
MRFLAIVPFILAIASAAPATNSNAATALQGVNDSAANAMKELQAAGCNVLKCVSALAAESAACGAAAAELGANFLADLACFASVGNNIAGNVCNGCL